MEPAHVGLILDSSVVIASERRGHTVRQILEQFKAGYGEVEVGLSVVTIVIIYPKILFMDLNIVRSSGITAPVRPTCYDS